MDLLKDEYTYRRGIHQLAVINTDLTESESMIRTVAEEARERNPQAFAGKQACVYYKMPYIAPCDSFHELRRLILRIRESTGLRANFQGVVAVEVTEWVGHENEEYFSVFLKYLYDHRAVWKPAVILNNRTERQVQRFLSACSRYITPKLYDILLFADKETLCDMLSNAFKEQGGNVSLEAAEHLATTMLAEELKSARSLSLIERTVEELLSCAKAGREVNLETVRDYLENSNTLLAMMAGKVFCDERGNRVEKETL